MLLQKRFQTQKATYNLNTQYGKFKEPQSDDCHGL